MGKVVAFGEVMMRLSPPGYQRVGQCSSFDIMFGGAEANACVALSRFGMDMAYVTKLPENPLGDACLQTIRGFGVDVSGVARGGERLGVYYCEKGAAMRPPKVVYDRKYSSMATATASDFDWENLLSGADAFYFTGITPALSDALADIIHEACKTARRMGILVVCDVNYRAALWTHDRARAVLSEILPYSGLLMAGKKDAEIFGLPAASPEEAVKKLSEHFGVPRVASTLRESFSASDNTLSGQFYDAETGEIFKAKEYPVHIVDRVGGGDAFGAGMAYGVISGFPGQEAVEFATAASAIAHTIEGDFPYFSLSEVRALMEGNASGRIIR